MGAEVFQACQGGLDTAFHYCEWQVCLNPLDCFAGLSQREVAKGWGKLGVGVALPINPLCVQKEIHRNWGHVTYPLQRVFWGFA